MSKFSWEQFNRVPIIGILRGFEQRHLAGIIQAAVAGGLTTLEVTMNSHDASGQIREAVRLAQGRLSVGAGTVLNAATLERALAAGASFIVTPGLHRDVVRACLDREVPVFPGTLSPSEIAEAAALGVLWVKLFPADATGLTHLREVKEALPQVKLLATGGARLETLADLMVAGADGFGLGSPLFSAERIAASDWIWVEQRCRAFVEAYEIGVGRRTQPIY